MIKRQWMIYENGLTNVLGKIHREYHQVGQVSVKENEGAIYRYPLRDLQRFEDLESAIEVYAKILNKSEDEVIEMCRNKFPSYFEKKQNDSLI